MGKFLEKLTFHPTCTGLIWIKEKEAVSCHYLLPPPPLPLPLQWPLIITIMMCYLVFTLCVNIEIAFIIPLTFYQTHSFVLSIVIKI